MPKKKIPKHGQGKASYEAKQKEPAAQEKSGPFQEFNESFGTTCGESSSKQAPGTATAVNVPYKESDYERTSYKTQETVGAVEVISRKMEQLELASHGQQSSDTVSQVTAEEIVQPGDRGLPSEEPASQATTEASGMVTNGAAQESSAASPQGSSKKIGSSGVMREGHSGQKQAKDLKLPQLLLQTDEGKLDSSYYPVLVVNTPLQEENIEEIEEKFGFTSRINWNVVFDCNPNSNMTGLCKYVNGTKHVNTYSPEKFAELPESKVDEHRNDIYFPEKTTWVFLNGRSDEIDDSAKEKLSDTMWTKKRSKAVQKAVDFFTNPKVIPGGRAVVMFLLLSESDLLVMCSVFQQLYISESFEIGNFTIFAEDDHLVTRFIDKLEDRGIVSSKDLKTQCLAGHSWQEINVHMSLMVGPVETQPKLPMSNGKNCSLPLKVRAEWSDLSVLAQNECEHISMDQDTELAGEVERKFYQGHEVDWLNFYFSEKNPDRLKVFDHVLERDVYKDLKVKIERALESSEDKTNDIPVIKIFHEAGAGGTTIAKHALWDLHRRVRCGVINRITPKTVEQIEDFRRHGYGEDNPGPVVLMVDNKDGEIFRNFLENLEKGTKSQGYVSNVVLLCCMRVHDPETIKRLQKPSVAVQHKLGRKEIAWFTNKTKDLEARNVFSEQECPEELLGFMVMKNQCESDYLNNVVNRLMPKISPEMPREQRKQVNLLKYIALIQTFNPDFAMPVSACDFFMQKTHLIFQQGHASYRKQRTWEKDRPRYLKLLLIEEYIPDSEASVKGLKVFHPRIAEIIVEQLCIHLGEKRSDMFREFLESQVVPMVSHSKGYVVKRCRDLMVRRLKKDNGDSVDTEFSPFIEKVCEEEQGKAAAFTILQLGIDEFRDAIIAQQKARLHYKRYGEFDLALDVIDCAIGLNDKSSYIWVTKGLILQEKMTNIVQTKWTEYPTEEDMDKLMEDFHSASEAFQKAQEVMKYETTGQNYAGFVEEVATIFKLLKIIQKKVKPFFFNGTGDEELVKYLLSEYTPETSSVLHDHHETMKTLNGRVEAAFSEVEDYAVQVLHQNITGQYRPNKLPNLYQDREMFFSIPMSSSTVLKLSPATAYEARRCTVRKMNADGFHKIFKLGSDKKSEDLKKVQKLLRANLACPILFDVKNMLFASVALAVCCGEDLDSDEVRSLVETLKDMENSRNGCYGLFFELILNWYDEAVQKCSTVKIKSTAKELKKRWMKKYRTDAYDSLQSPSGRSGVLQVRPPKPATEFYLGKQSNGSVKSLVYRKPGFTHWEKGTAQRLLERLDGFRRDKNTLQYKPKGCEPIDVRLAFPLDGVPSEERVQFYLGFSFAGPIAYDPKAV